MQCSSLLHSIPFLPKDSRDLMVQWDIAIPSNSHSESAPGKCTKKRKVQGRKRVGLHAGVYIVMDCLLLLPASCSRRLRL